MHLHKPPCTAQWISNVLTILALESLNFYIIKEFHQNSTKSLLY